MNIDKCFSFAKQSMVTKYTLFVVALLQVTLLGSASAAVRKPNECGFASSIQA